VLAEQGKRATLEEPTLTPLGVSSAPSKSPASAATHWITTASGKRRNSTCRYYQNSKGRPCGPDEGVACKLCRWMSGTSFNKQHPNGHERKHLSSNVCGGVWDEHRRFSVSPP
jgi:hypothetical protein